MLVSHFKVLAALRYKLKNSVRITYARAKIRNQFLPVSKQFSLIKCHSLFL